MQLGDIDLKDQSFEPIGGVEGNAFTGRYDGGGYQITGFAQQRNCSLGNSYLGLFAVNLGELRDVHVEGTINTTKDAENSITAYVGGIAGQNGTGGVISECSANVDIRNANFAGWKNTYVGGLTGLNAGVIEKSYPQVMWKTETMWEDLWDTWRLAQEVTLLRLGIPTVPER